MSDSHATPAAGEKKSFPARLVGIAVAIILLIIFFFFTRASVPMVIEQAGGTLVDSINSMKSFATAGTASANFVRDFRSGWTQFLIEVLVFVVVGGFLVYVIKQVIGLVRGGDHGDGGHPPAAGGHH